MPDFFRRLLQSPIAWAVVLVCYWVTLFVATHVPPETPMLPGHGLDKVAHAAGYALLAALQATTWQLMAGRLTWRGLCCVWLVVVVYGAVDEWTQGFVGRHPSIWDWVADAVGAAVGLALFALVRSMRPLQRWLSSPDR